MNTALRIELRREFDELENLSIRAFFELEEENADPEFIKEQVSEVRLCLMRLYILTEDI